ncbi:RCC1 domain-containing protein [Lysinibacter sp. HNR]|uniref:RCC1 domain-containing protein n=1 Tax=Lysinibacter sp. HNR TaxID=3031408 RepID=UPI0024350A37|nr:RCC1 domain-containing protein [Lysinibacter sp. HNR]WGD37706.1 RCC1 domain-containing protein [Lysinibacter sp. HNR]
MLRSALFAVAGLLVAAAFMMSTSFVVDVAAENTMTPTVGPDAGGTTVTGTIPIATYTHISTGSSHTLAIGSDGYTYAWGFNGSGQLGNNTTVGGNWPFGEQPIG